MILGAIIVVIVGILIYNYFSGPSGETIPAAETEDISQDYTVDPEIGRVYIVKEGETLWDIAEKAYGSGYDWSQIAEANDITLGGSISAGQELFIPSDATIEIDEPVIPEDTVDDQLAVELEKESSELPEIDDETEFVAEVDFETNQVTISTEGGEDNAVESVFADTDSEPEQISIEHTSDEAIGGDKYTVQKGDTLWDISVRAYGDGYRWVEIAEANALTNPDLIHSGNEFVIPR